MKEFALKDAKASFVKAALFTIVLALLGGLAGFGYAKHKQSVSYTAARYVLVSHNISTNENQGNITSSDVQMMTSYSDLANDETVTRVARKYLSKSLRKEYSATKLSRDVQVKVKPQSLVMRFSVTTDNAKDAAAIVNAMAKAFQKELPKLQSGAGSVKLLAKATTDNTDEILASKVKKMTASGLALGGLIGIVISYVVITWKRVLK